LAQDVWDADLIHVTYDANQVSVEKLLKTIEKEGFQGAVKTE
jgi:hypothetical protein